MAINNNYSLLPGGTAPTGSTVMDYMKTLGPNASRTTPKPPIYPNAASFVAGSPYNAGLLQGNTGDTPYGQAPVAPARNNSPIAPQSNPNSQFSLLQTTKNPDIAKAAATTLTNENDLQNTAVKSFNDYLTEAKQSLASQSADVAGDTKTLTALPGQTATALNNISSNFATSANNSADQYAALNTGNAATVAGDISNLNNLNQSYVTNSQNALDASLQGSLRSINARSINPAGSTGDSSDYNQAVIGANADANLALQQNLSNMQIGQLQNYITPLQQQLYGQNVNQVQYAQQLQQQIAGMQTGSTEQIAALTQALAGRPAAEQQALLSSLNLPVQVAQQVMSSLPGPLNQLTSTDQNNTFYGLSSNTNGGSYALPGYGQPPVSAPYQPSALPGRSGYPQGPVTSGPQPMGAPQYGSGPPAPGAVDPSNPYNYASGQGVNAPSQMWNGYAYVPNPAAYNTYDPITGLMINPSDAYQSQSTPQQQGGGTGGAYAGGQYFPAGAVPSAPGTGYSQTGDDTFLYGY